MLDDDDDIDIQLQADKIRRERMEKRVKQQQLAEAEAAAALTREKKGEDVPLVGNLIGEDHANYVLMYNMLTGIRIGVSASQQLDLFLHRQGFALSGKNKACPHRGRLHSSTQIFL